MYPFIGPVPTYAIFYFGGILVHFVVGRWIATRTGLKRRVWIAAGLCYLFSMTAGAKVLFDLSVSQLDLSELLRIQHWTRGGLWGGLLVYFPLAIGSVLLLSDRKADALDLVAAALPIPMIVAKLGCLFNSCCYGKPCSLLWAVAFPEGARGAPPGVGLHPTQLYEIAVMILLLVLFGLLSSDRWRGTKLLWFLAIYGAGRALIELFRGDTDHQMLAEGLSTTQRICLGTATGAVILLAIVWRSRPRQHPTVALNGDTE